MELMSEATQFHFPDWPPRRLVIEATIAWGLRHLDAEYCDPNSAPWAVIRGVILAFLRHQLTDFDAQLRARCEHDPDFRDALARQIEQAAYHKYPWLAADPRPFAAPASEDILFLDSMAKDLADLRSLREQLLSAAKDLRRTGGSRDRISKLQSEATDIAKQIEEMYAFLTQPKAGEDAEGNWARGFVLRRDGQRLKRDYEFYSTRPLPPNRISYTGIQCPRCGVSVAQRKQLVNLGQGYSRVAVYSCHCVTYAVYRPYGWRPAPLTFEEWKQMVV
jgi:hypothetical protein